MLSPQQPSASQFGALATGIAAGTVLRFATLIWWPDAVPQFLTTQLSTAVAGLVIAISPVLRHPTLRGLSTGLAAAVAGLGILTLLAISSEPLLCALYLVVTPLSAVGGLAAGTVLRGMTSKETPGVDRR